MKILLLLSLILLVACDENTPVNSAKTRPHFYALLENSPYYTDSSGQRVDQNCIAITASITNDPPVAELEIIMNDSSSGILPCGLVPLSFFLTPTTFKKFINVPKLGNKHIVLASSAGKDSGDISIPDSLVLVSPQQGDTVTTAGTALQVKWSCNAERYYVIAEKITWGDSVNIKEFICDTIISDTSFTIQGTHINLDTWIIDLWVSPYNGPNPYQYPSSNMIGDGPGFLFATNSPKFFPTRLSFCGPKALGKSLSRPRKQRQITSSQILERLGNLIQ